MTEQPKFEELELNCGERFDTPRALWTRILNGHFSGVRIYGIRIDGDHVTEDASAFADARVHKTAESRTNLNFYEAGKVVAYMQIRQENVGQYRFEMMP